MDQPGLGHHDILHHGHESIHEQHLNTQGLRPPKITLRSMSKSDPNLSVPHLILSQDEQHPSLNRIVSGLFHVSNALRTPVPSSNQLQQHEHDEPMDLSGSHNHLVNSESSAALLGDTHSVATLRKSSSAIDWSGAVLEANRKKSNQLDWQTAVAESQHSHPPNFSLFNTSGEVGSPSPFKEPIKPSKEGGLVMNTSSDRKGNMSMVAAQVPSHGHFAQGLATSSAQSTTQATHNPLEQHVENHDRKPSHGGMFGNVFRQGFFSRPVVRSEDENYRYLMALDR